MCMYVYAHTHANIYIYVYNTTGSYCGYCHRSGPFKTYWSSLGLLILRRWRGGCLEHGNHWVLSFVSLYYFHLFPYYKSYCIPILYHIIPSSIHVIPILFILIISLSHPVLTTPWKASEEAKKSTMAQLEVQHGATPPASPGLLMATGYLRSFEPLQ